MKPLILISALIIPLFTTGSLVAQQPMQSNDTQLHSTQQQHATTAEFSQNPLFQGIAVNQQNFNLQKSVITNDGTLFALSHDQTKVIKFSADTTQSEVLASFVSPVSQFTMVYSPVAHEVAWLAGANQQWFLTKYSLLTAKVTVVNFPTTPVKFNRIAYDSQGNLWFDNQTPSQAVLYELRTGTSKTWINYQLNWPVTIQPGINQYDFMLQNFNSHLYFWFLLPTTNPNQGVVRATWDNQNQTLINISPITFQYFHMKSDPTLAIGWYDHYQWSDQIISFNQQSGSAYFHLNYEESDRRPYISAVSAIPYLATTSATDNPYILPQGVNGIGVGQIGSRFYYANYLHQELAYVTTDAQGKPVWSSESFQKAQIPVYGGPTQNFYYWFTVTPSQQMVALVDAMSPVALDQQGLYLGSAPTSTGAITFATSNKISFQSEIHSDYNAFNTFIATPQNNFWIAGENGLYKIFTNNQSLIKSLLTLEVGLDIKKGWINETTYAAGGKISLLLARNTVLGTGKYEVAINDITSDGAPVGKLFDNQWRVDFSGTADTNTNHNVTIHFQIQGGASSLSGDANFQFLQIEAEPQLNFSNRQGQTLHSYVGYFAPAGSQWSSLDNPMVSDFVFSTVTVLVHLPLDPVLAGIAPITGTYIGLDADHQPAAGQRPQPITQQGVMLDGTFPLYLLTVQSVAQPPHQIYVQVVPPSQEKQQIPNFWNTAAGHLFATEAEAQGSKIPDLKTLKRLDAQHLNVYIKQSNEAHWKIPPHQKATLIKPINANHHQGSSLGIKIGIAFGVIVGVILLVVSGLFFYPRIRIKWLRYRHHK